MGAAFPTVLVIQPASKRPTVLHPETIRYLRSTPPANPLVSIVIATSNNADFLRLCVESVLAAGGPQFELIVVDGGSTDGTREYLCGQRAVVTVSLGLNAGFAAGVNAGLKVARGERLVLLNDDTIVGPGWLDLLLAHLDDGAVGLAGPVSNQAPDAAFANTSYQTYGEFLAAAREHAGRAGSHRDVPQLTLFCAAMRRDVFELIGPLDERFEVGMFEDDDYCLRITAAGLKVRLAEDVLVHHFGEASLGKLAESGSWKAVFDANRQRFEAKWGRPWRGHNRADHPDYLDLIERTRLLAQALPEEARVLVASRGDERLLDLGRRAGHFPQIEGGVHAGSYPADDAAAASQLRRLKAAGWTHLAFPTPARWWLDHYPSLRGRLVADDPRTAVIFEL